MRKTYLQLIFLICEPILLLLLIPLALIARFFPKQIDVGIGPLPLISAKYHKKVFQKCGYSAESYVSRVWFITEEFDIRFDKSVLNKIPIIGLKINILRMFIWSIFRYRCLFIYFQGASLEFLGLHFYGVLSLFYFH